MQPFWEIVASNALLIVVLAAGIALLGRIWKNPLCLHLLWVLVLLKFITPPVVTVPLPFPARQVPLASEEHAANQYPAHQSHVEALRPETASITIGPEHQRLLNDRAVPKSPVPNLGAALVTQHQGIPWLTVLGWIWGVGIVLFASGHTYRILRFRKLFHSSQPPSSAVLSMAEEIAKRLGLRRISEIRMLPVCVSPLVWSLGGSPRVFLPAALFERLDGAAQEAILAHELAHVRRKDHWVRLLEVIITTLFWWHPVVWWATRHLQDLEDQCCDGIVVDMAPHGAKSYATALLDTLDFLSERSVPTPLGTTAAKSSISLTRRIAMLKNRSWTARLTFGRLMLLLTVAALPMALAFGQKPPEATEKTPPVVVERRAINRLVKDFPEKTDLSTPESALAAWSRNFGRKDMQGVLDLSWEKLFDTQTAREIEDALKNDPNSPKDLDQQMLGIEMIEVLTYHDDCAAVVCKGNKTAFGFGHDEGPYCAVAFARINGVWKYLACEETVSSSPQTAAENFEKKKDGIWRHFLEVRNDLKNGRTPTIRWPMN